MSPRPLALASFLLLGIVDALLTYLGVNLFGLVEGNVLMRALIERGWLYFFALKLGLCALLAGASLRIYPRVAPLVLSTIGAGVVVHNFALIASSL